MINQKVYLNWFVAFLFASVFLSFGHFQSTSNDSRYYSDLVVRYQNKDWSEVLTPKWGTNFWGFQPDSYMTDQLPGQIVQGVALAKLGVPASQSLHILGMAYQILSILLLAQIAMQFISKEESSVLLYALILTPMAFSYNIRANHELGIMFFSFLSLYSGLMLPKSKAWIISSILSCLGLMWIKGPFFIFGSLLSIIGFIFSPTKSKKYLWLIVSLFLSNLSVVVSAFLFELLYIKLTQKSFFLDFWNIQIQQRVLNKTENSHFFIIQKFLNFYYYFWHYLIYALPFSLVAICTLIQRRDKNAFFGIFKNRLLMCVFCSAMSFCLVFSLSNRIAARYVFPGYYLFAAFFILICYQNSLLLKKLHAKVLRWGLHIVVPALWLFTFLLHFI